MDPRWQHPFTCIVAGPTGCGKTTFVARLLRNASAMIDPPPERVTWYYGEWQTAYENLDIPNVRLEEGLPTSFDNGKRGLVVLDDLMAETDSRVTNLFTKKSHHSDTSVIYLVQNLFSKNKDSRTISLNAQYMIVSKKPARLVSARKLGPTDVPRSRRVRPGGVRRCDSLALRLSSDRPQTEHARRHASAHVRIAGRCTPVGLRTEVGVNLLSTGVSYRLSVESCLVE